MPPRQPQDRRTSLVRPVIVFILVLVVAAGVYARAHTPLSFTAAPRLSSTPVTIAFIVIEVLGAIFVLLLTLTIRRRRKKPEDEQHVTQLPGNRWMSLTVTTAILAMLVLLAYWLIKHFRSSRPGRQALPSVAPSPAPTRHGLTGPPSSGNHALWLVWLGLVVLAIAIVVAVAFWRRARVRAEIPLLEDEPTPDTGDEALRAGRRALDMSTDPRSAVIACYEAMERSLAGAGVERAPAQTPDELLAQARRRHAITSVHAAETLVELFGRARFSTRPVDTADVATAKNALTELLRDTPDRVGS